MELNYQDNTSESMLTWLSLSANTETPWNNKIIVMCMVFEMNYNFGITINKDSDYTMIT